MNEPDITWTKEKLMELVRDRLGDRLFIVVSNREPYVHDWSDGDIVCKRPVGGLTEALDPVLRASGGIWVAYGSGPADKQAVDENDRVKVPPGKPEYTLRRVWLEQDDVDGFYLHFSNEGIWPLCHITFNRPVFTGADWETYQKVNRIFADAVLKEINGREALVLVQDYHFALLSQYLRERSPDLVIGQFWHIPWPPYEIFRTCPWYVELLEGMLGNDLVGFHTPSYGRNFMDTVRCCLGVKTDLKPPTIISDRRTTTVDAFPISVDFAGLSRQAADPAVEIEMERLRKEHNLEGKVLGIGVDRVDYSKGIPERLMALDRLLENSPGLQGRLVFIQAEMPSRTDIQAYQETTEHIQALKTQINEKYSSYSPETVITMDWQLSHETLSALHRLADFCVVSSLHDGMNLVAKEFVSARVDGDGVLVLSRFAGAAEEMPEAVMINPYATDDFAARLKEAIEMPEAERRRRMDNLRRTVAGNNIYTWGASMVSRLISIAGD